MKPNSATIATTNSRKLLKWTMLTNNLKSLPRLLAGVVTKKQQHMQVWDAISYSTATPVFTGFRDSIPKIVIWRQILKHVFPDKHGRVHGHTGLLSGAKRSKLVATKSITILWLLDRWLGAAVVLNTWIARKTWSSCRSKSKEPQVFS